MTADVRPSRSSGMRYGSIVTYATERGTVVCMDPPIMRGESFAAYVAVRNMSLLTVHDEMDLDVRPIPETVRQRIVNYFHERGDVEYPTGGSHTSPSE